MPYILRDDLWNVRISSREADMSGEISFWIAVVFLVVVLVILLVALIRRKNAMDTDFSLLGMRFSLRMHNEKEKEKREKDASPEAESRVVIQKTKINGSTVGNLAGRNIRAASSAPTSSESGSSETRLDESEIRDSQLGDVAGRDISK